MPDDPQQVPTPLWTTIAAQGPRADDAAVRRDFGIFEFSREGAFLLSATAARSR